MVYKVIGEVGKARLVYDWHKDNPVLSIDGTTMHIPGSYTFNYKDYSLSDFSKFIYEKFIDVEKRPWLIFLYSNFCKSEVEDLLKCLEEITEADFVLFLKG